jgi:hypothetical protein
VVAVWAAPLVVHEPDDERDKQAQQDDADERHEDPTPGAHVVLVVQGKPRFLIATSLQSRR